jgi:hypothetical protein
MMAFCLPTHQPMLRHDDHTSPVHIDVRSVWQMPLDNRRSADTTDTVRAGQIACRPSRLLSQR